MQTIPSNLNAEELLSWYDSTWNKLTNSEMEQRLADALREALDELDTSGDQDKREEELDKREESLDDRESELDAREAALE